MSHKLLLATVGLFCTALVCFGNTWAADAPPDARRLDLSACIKQALQANPKIEEANFDVNQAEWQLKSAKYARIGKIELFNLMGAVEDTTAGRSGNPALTGDTVDGQYGFFKKLDLKMSVPIYTFGRLTYNTQAAAENLAAQIAAGTKTTNELLLKVHELYYGLVVSRQLLESTQDVQKNFSDARDAVEKRLEKGTPNVTESDLLKIRVGLAGVTKAVNKLERESQLAKEALRRTLGLPELSDFDVADQILKPVAFELKPLEDYLARAEVHNPDIKRLKAAVAAEEARYQAEKARFYPTVLAVGGVRHSVAPGRVDPDNPFLVDDFHELNAGAALALQWDLNLLQTNTEAHQKKAKAMKMKSTYRDGANGVALQVKDKYHRVKEKQANLEASFEARKAGRALLVLNLTNFKFGIGSGKDLFDALSLYARTAGEYFETVFEYNMAVAELQSVTGNIHPQTAKD
jgi:outer membrane protein TolC